MEQPKKVFHHIVVVECQNINMHQPPQHSCKYVFHDRWRWEFGTCTVNLSMFSFFYYDLTLGGAANKTASSHVVECQIKIHQMSQHSCNYSFSDWCSFEFGTSTLYLSMFTNFYYYWTLAEATKSAVKPHCCRMPKNEDAYMATKLL